MPVKSSYADDAWRVMCGCGVQTYRQDTEAEARTAWNTRAALTRPTAASAVEVERLKELLRRLENANDRVCGARPQAVYTAMINAGMGDALTELDEARRDARAALRGQEVR